MPTVSREMILFIKDVKIPASIAHLNFRLSKITAVLKEEQTMLRSSRNGYFEIISVL